MTIGKNISYKLDKRLVYACDIPNIAQLVAQGVSFPHPVGIVISSHAKIGHGCKIWQNVTIGAKDDRDAQLMLYPTLKNNVNVYAGAVIFGNIFIGQHAVIGCNAVVNTDVLPFSIVAGSPARRIGINKEALYAHQQQYRKNQNVFLQQFEMSEHYSNILPGSVCIDCGANLGAITAMLADKGATVYAFEPHPLCAEKLRERFKGTPTVKIIEKAAFDQKKPLRLYRSALDSLDAEFFSENSSLYSSKINVNNKRYYDVEGIDLASFISSLGRDVDLLKIDVEGAEYSILDRMIESGAVYKVKNILVETHEDRIPEIREQAQVVRKKIKDMQLAHINLDWL